MPSKRKLENKTSLKDTKKYLETLKKCQAPMKHHGNTFKNPLKLPGQAFQKLLTHCWNIPETTLKLHWHTFETSVKHSCRILLKTCLKHPWNIHKTLINIIKTTFMDIWNMLEINLKKSLNFLETLKAPLKFAWASFETPLKYLLNLFELPLKP